MYMAPWAERLVDLRCWQMREAQQKFAHSKDCTRKVDANAQLAKDAEIDVGPGNKWNRMLQMFWEKALYVVIIIYFNHQVIKLKAQSSYCWGSGWSKECKLERPGGGSASPVPSSGGSATGSGYNLCRQKWGKDPLEAQAERIEDL